MSISADITIRAFIKKEPCNPLIAITRKREVDIDLLARFWIQTFGFFYDSILESVNPLKEKVKKLQATALDVYKDCRAGSFTQRIHRIVGQASYYGGDDPELLRRSQLHSLSYLPFPLSQLQSCQLQEASDQAIVEMVQKEYQEQMKPLMEWVEGKKLFKDLSEAEQIQLEKILFSKAALIWEGDCYNWYNVAQMWISLEGEEPRFLEKLPVQSMLVGNSTASLTDVMQQVIREENGYLSSLSFRQFVAHLSAISVGKMWNIRFPREISQAFAQNEVMREQALLYAHNHIHEPSSHFFKCLNNFIKIRKHMFAGQEVQSDYNVIFDWIYFSSVHDLWISLDQVAQQDLKDAFQIVQEWREITPIQVRHSFLIFKLIAEDRGVKHFNASLKKIQKEKLAETISSYKTIEAILRALGRDSFGYQIDMLHSSLLFSLSEKLDIASTLYTSKLGIECYRDCILFLQGYQVPSPFLKCLLISWLKSEVPPDMLSEQRSLIQSVQKLIGVRLNSVTAYVWLAFCPDHRKMKEILQEFEKAVAEIAAQASNSQLSPPLLQSFQHIWGSLVGLSSDRKNWKSVQKQFLSPIKGSEASFPSEWGALVSGGIEIGDQCMLAETMNLLMHSTLPIGEHLFFSNFICGEAMMDQEVKIGEEDVYFQRSHTLYPYQQSSPQWRGIYRSWDIPIHPKNYPIFNLVLVDLNSFQMIMIRETVGVAWEHFQNHPELSKALHQMAIDMGEDHYEDRPASVGDQVKIPVIEGIDVEPLFRSFIEKIKVQFRRGVLKLNPHFAGHLPQDASSLEKILDEKGLSERYDQIIEKINIYLTQEIRESLEKFDIVQACEDCIQKEITAHIPLKEVSFEESLGERPLSFSYSLIFKVDTKKRSIDPTSILREVVLRCHDQTQMVRYPEELCAISFKKLMRWQLMLLMHQIKDSKSEQSDA